MSSTNPITGKQEMDPAHVIKDDNGEPAPEPPKPDPTGGRGFGALMQDAVKLKEEQMKSGKKNGTVLVNGVNILCTMVKHLR